MRVVFKNMPIYKYLCGDGMAKQYSKNIYNFSWCYSKFVQWNSE